MRDDFIRKAAKKERDLRKADDRTILESIKKAAAAHYDVFLSHAYADRELVQGLTAIFRSFGLTVYVDWIEDPDSNRRKVTAANADMLRERMAICDSLVVAYSANSSVSPWVTWELAYFDGIKRRVAVVPIEPGGAADADGGFAGQEYLQLYPVVDVLGASNGQTVMWSTARNGRYSTFNEWKTTGKFSRAPP